MRTNSFGQYSNSSPDRITKKDIKQEVAKGLNATMRQMATPVDLTLTGNVDPKNMTVKSSGDFT